jgi:hypothetical protein
LAEILNIIILILENNKLDTEIDACPTQSGHILNNLSQTEVGNDTENEDNDNTNVCMPCELVTDKNASRTI